VESGCRLLGSTRSALLGERAVAFIERPECLISRDRLDELVTLTSQLRQLRQWRVDGGARLLFRNRSRFKRFDELGCRDGGSG
jgi:hypothetical protein